MSVCPSRDELKQLLADQLTDGPRGALETHVETCAACQETLARVSDEGGNDVDTQLFRLPFRTPLAAFEVDFVQHLKENPPDSGEEASPEDSAAELIVFPGPPTEKGPLGQLGGFAICRVVGAGSFGVVYQAYDELDQFVALKILRPELAASPHERARFEKEGRKGAAVKHDHIVAIHQVGHTPGFALPYLVMEYVEGESLSERLHRQGVIPAREAARIVRQVALALAAAHAHDLRWVHRDIKPSNILLEASSGRAKLTDFGLARALKAAGASISRSGQIVGAPGYMSPEQISTPDKVDERSDLYSLGVVLYELLAGERPFRAVTPQLLLQQVVHEEPRLPRKLNDGIPRDLEAITLKCLTKEPDGRYQTAAELADELQRWLDGKPTQARPVGVPGKAWRWCRRNPFEAAVAVLGVVALMAMTAFSISLVFIAGLHEAKRKTEDALEVAKTYRRQADRLSTQLALEAGQSLCEQGEIARGMLRWASGLKTAAADHPDFEVAIRANLATWSRRISTLKGCTEHPGYVRAIAFGPGGLTVVSGGPNSPLSMWEATTAKETCLDPEPQTQLWAVACSHDGRMVVTARKDGIAQLWDVASKQRVGAPLRHGKGFTAAAFARDGKAVLTGSDDGTAQLWDVPTRQPLGLPFPHSAAVNAVALSPDGKIVATGGEDGVTCLWDAATAQQLGPPLQHGKDPIFAVAFSPDNQVVVTGARTAQFWNVATGSRIWKPLKHGELIRTISFSPNGKSVLTGSEDDTAQLWDADSGKPLGSPLQHTGWVLAATFSPDGRTIVTGGAEKAVRIWDAVREVFQDLTLRHSRPVHAVAFSHNARLVATACADGKARLWDASTGEPIGQSMVHKAEILSVAFSPNDQIVLTASADSTAQLWSVTTGKPLYEPPLTHEKPIVSAAFSPDGKTILTASHDGTARLWNASTGKPLALPSLQQDEAIWAAAFKPLDGATIVTGGLDGTARLWDAATGLPRGDVLHHEGWVYAVAFSPDGKKVMTGSEDHTARLWDAVSGKPMGVQIFHQQRIRTVAFSPDGRKVLTGSDDGTAQLWDASTGNAVGAPLQHLKRVRKVAFSLDGRLVATGSDDGTARLWDAQTGEAIGYSQHGAAVWALVFTADGKTLLTGSGDGTTRLWRIPVAPLRGTPDQILLWTQVVSGRVLDANGTLPVMDVKRWQQCRQQLEELHGPLMP